MISRELPLLIISPYIPFNFYSSIRRINWLLILWIERTEHCKCNIEALFSGKYVRVVKVIFFDRLDDINALFAF